MWARGRALDVRLAEYSPRTRHANCHSSPRFETQESLDTPKECKMFKVKAWAIAALVVVALAGVAVVSPVGRSVAEDRIGGKDYWRHHEGHWSHWNAEDKRWYYTDGSHWFYHDGDAWKTYRFDKKFGREGFERGEYKVPGEDVRIVVPRHKVYRPR
jgi:hypothetical protein